MGINALRKKKSDRIADLRKAKAGKAATASGLEVIVEESETKKRFRANTGVS